MTSIEKRNQQILQLRSDGVARKEVARRFHLSPNRIFLIETRDADDYALMAAAAPPVALFTIGAVLSRSGRANRAAGAGA